MPATLPLFRAVFRGTQLIWFRFMSILAQRNIRSQGFRYPQQESG